MNTVYDVGPTVAIYADSQAGRLGWSEIADELNARTIETLTLAEIVARPLPPGGIDVVLLDAREDGGAALDRLLDRIDDAAREGRHASVIAIPVALIDVVAARTPHPDVVVLCDPSPLDRSAALALALTARNPTVFRDRGEEPPIQLRRLSEEVGRIARALAALSAPDEGAALPLVPIPPEADVELPGNAAVRATIRARRLREQYFEAELFADPAWDMLLDLFLARLEQRAVAVSSLCIAAAVPATTALRWIKKLTDEAIFVRQADPRDGRRVFIALSAAATRAMAAYFQAIGRVGVQLG